MDVAIAPHKIAQLLLKMLVPLKFTDLLPLATIAP